jgi:hypothetical protein
MMGFMEFTTGPAKGGSSSGRRNVSADDQNLPIGTWPAAGPLPASPRTVGRALAAPASAGITRPQARAASFCGGVGSLCSSCKGLGGKSCAGAGLVSWIAFEIFDHQGAVKYSIARVTSLPVSKANVAESRPKGPRPPRGELREHAARRLHLLRRHRRQQLIRDTLTRCSYLLRPRRCGRQRQHGGPQDCPHGSLTCSVC